MKMFSSTAALLLVLAAPPSAPAMQTGQRAAAAHQAGPAADREVVLRRRLGKRPEWRDGWWELGTLLYRQQRFGEARVAFERLLALAPGPGPAGALLGICEYEMDDFASATKHLKRWAAQRFPGPPELGAAGRFHLALLLTRAGEFERAAALLADQVARGAAGPELKEALGLASLRLAHTPRTYPAGERERVMLAGQVALLLGQDQLTRALSALASLRRRYPAAPETDYFAGTVLLRHSRSEAAAAFRRELEANPRHLASMLQLAEDALARSEPADGLAWAAKAAEFYPGDFAARAVYGRVLFALARYGESARELEAARRLAPDSYAVHFALARTYDELGRTHEAQRERVASERLREDAR